MGVTWGHIQRERVALKGVQGGHIPEPEPPAGAWADEPTDREFDAARDELLTGEDIYSPEWPAPVRRPSRTVLQTVCRAHNPARLTAVAPGGLSSLTSGSSGATAPSSSTSGVRVGPDAA